VRRPDVTVLTSLTFILGVVPLVIARGAGAASQQALGTAVFGGMLVSTMLSIFFVPVFYVVFQSLSEWSQRHRSTVVELHHAKTDAG